MTRVLDQGIAGAEEAQFVFVMCRERRTCDTSQSPSRA